jgi:hypothetical protein
MHSRFYNMFVKLRRVLANILKIQKSYFREFYFIHHLYLNKEIPKGLISKILLGITCYYSLLMFG